MLNSLWKYVHLLNLNIKMTTLLFVLQHVWSRTHRCIQVKLKRKPASRLRPLHTSFRNSNKYSFKLHRTLYAADQSPQVKTTAFLNLSCAAMARWDGTWEEEVMGTVLKWSLETQQWEHRARWEEVTSGCYTSVTVFYIKVLEWVLSSTGFVHQMAANCPVFFGPTV